MDGGETGALIFFFNLYCEGFQDKRKMIKRLRKRAVI